MLHNILKYIFIFLCDNMRLIMLTHGGNFYFFFKKSYIIKNKNYYVYLNFIPLINAIITLINIFSIFLNIIIFMYIFNLDLISLFQYNIIFFLDFFVLFMFKFYNWWLQWFGFINFFENFITYPWVFVLLLFIIIYLKKNKYFKFFKSIEKYCTIETSLLEEC